MVTQGSAVFDLFSDLLIRKQLEKQFIYYHLFFVRKSLIYKDVNQYH